MAVIVVTHGIPQEGFAILREAGHQVIIPEMLKAFSHEELEQLLPQADAVVAGGRLDAGLIRNAKNLRIIANYGAGYDGVDVKAAAECGVPVTNIPETTAESTAELAIGLMLAVSRRIGEMNLRMRREAPEGLFGMGREMGYNLRGQTLGVIGVGRIGRCVAGYASALGMRVIGYSRHGVPEDVCTGVSMEELLKTADVISLNCPLTETTRGLIGEQAFSMMKPGAILINTARGAVIDTQAMCAALTSGKLRGVGLDVYPDEPHVPEVLLAFPQAVLTPHVGTNTAQTRFEMAQACSRQIMDALASKRPVNIVNGL